MGGGAHSVLVAPEVDRCIHYSALGRLARSKLTTSRKFIPALDLNFLLSCYKSILSGCQVGQQLQKYILNLELTGTVSSDL